jgi:hypothetical protein
MSLSKLQSAKSFLSGIYLDDTPFDLVGAEDDVSNSSNINSTTPPVVTNLEDRLFKSAVSLLFRNNIELRAVLLDTAPYHRLSRTEQELWQAAFLWRRQFGSDNSLHDYHRVVDGNVALDLGVYHHPALCRYKIEDVTEKVFAPQCFISVLTDTSLNIENDLEDSICEQHRKETEAREIGDLDIQTILKAEDVTCNYTWRTFSEIGVLDKMPAFARAREERMKNLPGATLIEKIKNDFKLINRVNHRRVDEMLEVYGAKQVSAMIVLPFDISFNGPGIKELSGLEDFTSYLPDTYLGASWLYLVIDASNDLGPERIRQIIDDVARSILQETMNEVLPQLVYSRGRRYRTEVQSVFAHQTSAVIDSILDSVGRLPEDVRSRLGGLLLAKLHLLRATINSYRTKASRVNRGPFEYPWKPDDNPLAIYRDIGIQLGYARAQDAPKDEPKVRDAGRVAARLENQPGSERFELYRRNLFEELPRVTPSTAEHLKHSNFAVLILLAIKQAVYHTIRAHQYGDSQAKISMRVRESEDEVIFECTLTNPRVTPEDQNKQAKDTSELSELADRLSDLPEHPIKYSVDGPIFDPEAGHWRLITRIHAQKEHSPV